MSVFLVIACFGLLMLALAALLAVADQWLRVAEDPRIDAVEQMLPHANCGACGLPGCRPFAQALVEGSVLPSQCTVATPDQRTQLAAFLGTEVGSRDRVVARLACAGGTNVARQRARYQGMQSCEAAALVSGGGKGCAWGCLGLGDCALACDFDALHMDPHTLPRVDEAACTACGDCVRACPKDLFSLHSVAHRLWVACASRESGDEVLAECEVGCTACGRCALDAPSHIVMQDALPRIDYAFRPLARDAIERCPTGAIGWFDGEAGFRVGTAARRVIRQAPRPDGAT